MRTSNKYDSSDEKYILGARNYSPDTGRFLSEDPLKFFGNDLNLYRYTLSNPLIFSDPMGLLVDPTVINNEGQNNTNSGGGVGPKNAFKHCYTSCMQTAENGEAFAYIAGYTQEFVQNMTGQSQESYSMDLHNNSVGRVYGGDGGTGGNGGAWGNVCPSNTNPKIPSAQKCQMQCKNSTKLKWRKR